MKHHLPHREGRATKGAPRAAFAILLVALAVPAATGATAKFPPSGAADASSTLVSLAAGGAPVTAATDVAQATAGVTPYAYARLDAGAAGAQNLGHAEKESKTAGDKQSESLADQTFNIPDLLDFGLANATVQTEIGTDVTSSVSVDFGHVDVMKGFVTIDGGSSSSATRVSDKLAHVTRQMTFASLHTFSLRRLMEAEGVSPLDMTCTAVENIGTQLAVDTSAACAQVVAAQAAVDGAKSTLQSAAGEFVAAKNSVIAQIATVQTQKNATLAQIDTATAARNAALAQAATLQTQLNGYNAQQASLLAQTSGLNRAAIQAARDALAPTCAALLPALQGACNQTLAGYDAQLALFGQLDSLALQIAAAAAPIEAAAATAAAQNASIASLNSTLDAQTATLTQLNSDLDGLISGIALLDPLTGVKPTCSAMSNALDAAANQVPTVAVAADAAKANVDAKCTDATDTLDSLIDVPLISMDAITLSVDAVAQPNPTITLSGNIGSLRVGNLAPVALDLPLTAAQVKIVEGIVRAQLATIVQATGVSIPVPDFQFMVTNSNKGRRTDGTWYANGSISTLRIHFAPIAVDLTGGSPLALLGNGTTLTPSVPLAHWAAGSGSTFGAPYGAILAANQQGVTPDIVFDLGKFQAAGTYHDASGGISIDPTVGTAPPVSNGAPSTPGAPASSPASHGATHGTRRYGANGRVIPLPHTGVGSRSEEVLAIFMIGMAVVMRRYLRRA